jgi:exodeoxyribonuclease VII large subunit
MADTYLDTPYRDRERVKALGARWDAAARKWYVPEGRDLAPFSSWLGVASPRAAYGAAGSGLANPSAQLPAAMATGLTTGGAPGVSLSQLMAVVADAVSGAFRSGVWTRVEVVKADARRGHVYLELAERSADGDAVAQARAMIWADTARQIVPGFERATGVVLGAGIKLLLRARPTVHALYGLSLVVDAIDPDYTLGDLEARKREIRDRLQREGLFDANRRLPPPWDFQEVVVAAPEGAAGLGDFRADADRLEARGLCRFRLVHSRFQGEGAAAEILAALTGAQAQWTRPGRAAPDALVIIRGGGAVNDLAWLNDYALARFICELDVPVLTGIGHERDNTVLDEVANQRFDTPSKVIAGIEQLIVRRAAEAKTHFDHLMQIADHDLRTSRLSVVQLEAAVKQGAQRQLAQAREGSDRALAQVRFGALQAVQRASERSRDRHFEVRQQAAEQIGRARQAVPSLWAEVRAESRQMLRTASSLAQGRLDALLERARLDAEQATGAADRALDDLVAGARASLADAGNRTEAAMREIAGQGPEKTLGRGFAIVRHAHGGTPVTRARALSAGTALDIQFHDGRIAARTDDRSESDPR